MKFKLYLQHYLDSLLCFLYTLNNCNVVENWDSLTQHKHHPTNYAMLPFSCQVTILEPRTRQQGLSNKSRWHSRYHATINCSTTISWGCSDSPTWHYMSSSCVVYIPHPSQLGIIRVHCVLYTYLAPSQWMLYKFCVPYKIKPNANYLLKNLGTLASIPKCNASFWFGNHLQ
jgi:hypothetical protein